jgi:hypothetical protein
MSNWNSCIGVLTGYLTSEADFGARVGRATAQVTQALDDLVARMASAGQNASSMVVLQLTGHADRQDAPGLTPEQRRASELDAATQRVASASAWFISQLTPLAGPPDEGGNWPRLLVVRSACGAAELVHVAPASEQERQDNRRVEIDVRASNASEFPLDGEVIDLG